FKQVRVLNGDEGWLSLNGVTKELTKAELAEAGEQLHASSLARLLPLEDKSLKVSPAGADKVGDREAVGVRVESKGHRALDLYFDKESGRLLKSVTKAKSVQGEDQTEHTVETLFSDYKEVGGIPLAHKYTIRRDGRLFAESEATEIKTAARLDDKLFAKP